MSYVKYKKKLCFRLLHFDEKLDTIVKTLMMDPLGKKKELFGLFINKIPFIVLGLLQINGMMKYEIQPDSNWCDLDKKLIHFVSFSI